MPHLFRAALETSCDAASPFSGRLRRADAGRDDRCAPGFADAAPHGPPGRRKVDIVFPKAQVAVFVDGCFWHGCPEHARETKSNTLWWADKIAANKARDAETTGALRDAGWIVERVWEHENPLQAANRLARLVRDAQPTTKSKGRATGA